MDSIISVNNKCKIGGNNKTFVIAELSGNHNHDFDVAKKTLFAMKDAGADAVKLQTYTPDTLTIDCDNKYFKIKDTLWNGKTLYQLYKEAYTPWDWHKELFKLAKDIGLICFSTPFDKSAVDYLEKLDVPMYKIASFEANDLSLIEYVAKKNKPIIVSVGMSTLSEIQDIVDVCKKNGNSQLILLKCTSAYPAPYEDMNLLTMPNLRDTFKTIVGLSDHSLGIVAPVVAVALGAKVIEKHFILDKMFGGPDSEFSLEPLEFSRMVKSIRETEKSLGEVKYELSEKQEKSRQFMRSLFVVKDVKKGEKFSEKNIRSIRPGYGLSPKFFNKIVGKKAIKNIKRGTPLNWDLI